MFGNSPFNTNNQDPVSQVKNADVIFVADYFADELTGGAELTSQALITSSPFNVYKVKSRNVSMQLLEAGFSKYWIFGNYTEMDRDLIPSIAANLNYSILEYDYKYCKYRSPEKHLAAEGTECNCQDDTHGKITSAFFYGANSLWWMSEKQYIHYVNLFPFLEEKENVVLSSVFSEDTFLKISELNEKNKDKERSGWIVLKSSSWIKGTQAALDWCKENDKKHEIVSGLTHHQLLERLSLAEGFVYLPLGGDTCPRMVIEAKLLGCKLQLNENVQHASEEWFSSDNIFDTQAYMYATRQRFWNGIKHNMEYTPSLSGYTTTFNCIKNGYPWKATVNSLLGFCDEVVIVDGGSEDGTWKEILEWSKNEPRLVVHQEKRDWESKRFAVFDGAQKAVARSLCTKDFCWQMDADEVVHEDDYGKVKEIMRHFPSQVKLMSLPVIEYWGCEEKIRMDVNPWKWRLSKNDPSITHGIPGQFRKTDAEGNLYASPGTDGCDYIHKDTYEVIAHANFYTNEVHQVRIKALTGQLSGLAEYQGWLRRVADALPSVYHYSWFNLERKIRTYRDYWSKHWQSLYDITQEDSVENNMFFDKKWEDVTDEDISNLAVKLRDEMGGWVFHEKVDFNRATPHATLERKHPVTVLDWIKENV